MQWRPKSSLHYVDACCCYWPHPVVIVLLIAVSKMDTELQANSFNADVDLKGVPIPPQRHSTVHESKQAHPHAQSKSLPQTVLAAAYTHCDQLRFTVPLRWKSKLWKVWVAPRRKHIIAMYSGLPSMLF